MSKSSQAATVQSSQKLTVSIHSERQAVAGFLELVREAADANKDALGFLPYDVYLEAAVQEKLLVAVVHKAGKQHFGGYLLFGGTFPNAKIFQIYTEPTYRRLGIAQQLVEDLVKRMEAVGYLGISARVAEDLDANVFWQEMDFETVAVRRGGQTRNRNINIRVRELNTPSLFKRPSVVASPFPDLMLIERLASRSPLFGIDLNVFFDVTLQRLRASEATQIISAGFQNVVRLIVAEEFIEELKRNSTDPRNDPVLRFALELPRAPRPELAVTQTLISELASIVFPAQAAQGSLTVNARSDLIHLATAIHHKTTGFITSDTAILRARKDLWVKYGIDVIGVSDFAEITAMSELPEYSTMTAILSGRSLTEIKMAVADVNSVTAFLQRIRIPAGLITDAIRREPSGPAAKKVIVKCESDIVAFASWEFVRNSKLEVFLCANEENPTAGAAIERLLDTVCREASAPSPALIQLKLPPGTLLTQRIAREQGFRPATGQIESCVLQKVSIGRVVEPGNWPAVRLQLKQLCGVELPENSDSFGASDQPIEVVSPLGTTVRLTVAELESLLSPALFLGPGRDGVVVPIRRKYADELFQSSKQLTFLASREAVFLTQRVYFNSPRAIGCLRRGAPILFYESSEQGRGRGSIISIARINRTEIVSKEAVWNDLARRGVLDPHTIDTIAPGERIAATLFDNIMVFEHPVSLNKLRELNCADGSNFVTAKAVTAEQIMQIVREGSPHG